jgi:hypothetical protein
LEEGREAVVDRVNEDGRRLFVRRREGGHDELGFSDVTPLRPLRRDPVPEYREAIIRIHSMRAYKTPLMEFLASELRRVGWNPDDPQLQPGTSTAEAYMTLEREKWSECLASLRERLRILEQRFSPRTWQDRTELWKQEWAEWVGVPTHVVKDFFSRIPELHFSMEHSQALEKVQDRLDTRAWTDMAKALE